MQASPTIYSIGVIIAMRCKRRPRHMKTQKNFLYALANTRYNPKNVEDHNRQEAQKANVSMAAHNQRMQQKQQQFELSQRAFESKRDAINASITKITTTIMQLPTEIKTVFSII
jgi:hypothetical protein